MTPDQTNINTKLWASIEAFDFDYPISGYNFSTRLASENKWTIYFTKKAILEYKKFMYLAANAEFMISPSETVDKVWHLHLIFTRSYTEFCNLLGKTIHHIPSTRGHDEQAKFQQAKEDTKRYYNEVFGDMPDDIWKHENIYQSLGWEKRKSYLSVFVVAGLLVSFLLLFPLYYLLKPLYVYIDNPYFLIGYISIVVLSLFWLERHNKLYLHNLLQRTNNDSFIYHLQPGELIYLQSQQLASIIHNSVNQLVEENKIEVNNDGTLRTTRFAVAETAEEFAVKETLQEAGGSHYRLLLRYMAYKAVFTNTVYAMKEVQKQFRDSKSYSTLFRFNFIVLVSLFLPGFIRLLTGIDRGKPVSFIGMALFILLFAIIGWLSKLSFLFCNKVLPNWYKYHILPNNPQINQYEWLYFMTGTNALSASLIPLITSLQRSSTTAGDSGSSCGSDCGSSCGGGDGGGCGGCGGD